jgi:hypothetical protein
MIGCPLPNTRTGWVRRLSPILQAGLVTAHVKMYVTDRQIGFVFIRKGAVQKRRPAEGARVPRYAVFPQPVQTATAALLRVVARQNSIPRYAMPDPKFASTFGTLRPGICIEARYGERSRELYLISTVPRGMVALPWPRG